MRYDATGAYKIENNKDTLRAALFDDRPVYIDPQTGFVLEDKLDKKIILSECTLPALPVINTYTGHSAGNHALIHEREVLDKAGEDENRHSVFHYRGCGFPFNCTIR